MKKNNKEKFWDNLQNYDPHRTTPNRGQLWFDVATQKVKIYDGYEWVRLAPEEEDTDNG